MNLKIGDAGRLIRGKHQYVIFYKYNYYDNKNEFYHNIIGTSWQVPIHKAEFNVTMPKDISPSDVGLSIGRNGVQGFNGGAYYSVGNQRNITGQTTRILNPGEGITVRVQVPAKYFKKHANFTAIIVISLELLLTLIAFLTWYVYGKDEPVTPIVNFYPPKGMNPLETELAYKGTASTKGIVGLLIDLAHRGYIKITDNGHQWSLNKIKDYDGIKPEEKTFMNSIFKNKTVIVQQSDLTYSRTFYTDCANIIADINKRRERIFYQNSISFAVKFKMFLYILGLLFLTIFSASGYNIFNIAQNFFLILFPTIALCVIIGYFNSGRTNACTTLFFIVWSAGFGGIPLLMFLLTSHIQNIPSIFIGLAGLIASGICLYQLPKRNPAGQRMLNDLLGLKHFIEVAEKSRLQRLAEQDPEYFYNVLPSAYILDVSDKWINKFESIMEINPDWYSGSGFNTTSFNNFVTTTQAVSAPSVANGGVSTSSSGGGGHSGGGGGGGGGGSW